MNNLDLKPLNTMEQAIYTRVQSHLKIAYDKEQLQKDCEIKSKIWVTRSVNTLIKSGFIKEIKDEQSMESFLVLSSFDEKPPHTHYFSCGLGGSFFLLKVVKRRI